MTIKLTNLFQDRATATVDFGGETATVTYRPSAVTPAVEDKLQAELASNTPGAAGVNFLVQIIAYWDIEDENGEQLPVSVDVLRNLPSRFLTAVLNAILADMQAGEDTKKNLDAGSFRKGK